MSKAYYESIKEIGNSGIILSYQTVPGGYHPLHWHEELELLYPLNGAVDINIEGKKYDLPVKQLMVVESCEVHSTYSYNSPSMFLCIHLSKKHMQQYMPDIELYQIHCKPEEIADEDFPFYLEICKMLETLTRIYIEDAAAFQLEAEGIVLQILAHLIRHFSTNTAPQLDASDALTRERIRQIITYVEEHFREPISLSDISEELGLGKEYFCRFFKKNMGLSFLNYLNEIRLTHVYQDLITTDAPITEIMEANGITNQKLFNRSFKKLYGCTPSAIRKPS
ncbi:AraC family transcriptional regulator [Bariatricus sp. SGI.154]|uniref:AraC family transcriptional regulator n=1 Tax=Bariatricus sp. SGI.154 TaxID=3420549 RepID=UPI003CFD60B0